MRIYNIFFILLFPIIAFSSNSIIENIISSNSWNEVYQNLELVISENLVDGEKVKSKVLNAKIKSLNQKIEMSTAIGEIVHSLLEEDDFISSHGDCWVSIKGQSSITKIGGEIQNIIDTDYGVLTSKTSLPDARNKFLRNAGGNASNVGETQSYATALPNNNFITNESGRHRHEFDGIAVRASGNTHNEEYDHDGSLVTRTDLAGKHTHTITSGGDEETRPENLTVNMFIRVNNVCNFEEGL